VNQQGSKGTVAMGMGASRDFIGAPDELLIGWGGEGIIR